MRRLVASTILAVSALVQIITAGAATTHPDLDPTFSGDGIVSTSIAGSDYAYGGAIQADGKIIAVGTITSGNGSWDFGVVRYLPNGSLDATFSSDGKATTSIGSESDFAVDVVVQPDGKVIVAGYTELPGTDADFALVRYNTDGSPDTGFSTDGIVTTSFGSGEDNGHGVALQADGKIVVAGTSGGDFALARYNTDGSPDNAFGVTGKVTTPIGASDDAAVDILVQPDGKIVAVGASETVAGFDFAVARYDSAGVLDNGFSSDGKVMTPIGTGDDIALSTALQPDGKILAAGFGDNGDDVDFALARFTTDGSLDPTLSDDGVMLRPNGPGSDYGMSVVVQPDGKILIGGESSPSHLGSSGFGIVRLNPNGSLDPTFSTDGRSIVVIGSASQGGDVLLQPDGKIVMVGFTFTGDTVDFALARLVPVRTFFDVPGDHWAFDAIEKLVASEITGGCRAAPPFYCPEQSVTRAQMAVFLVRAMGEEGNLPAYQGYFSDVPAGQFYTAYVERLYELGVTAGCTPTTYCPSSPVTREQMAVFLLRGIGHAGHLAPYQGTFADVPSSNTFARFIEHLYEHGVTSGCATGPLRYCPGAAVTRAQMAVFIVNAFGL